MRKLVILLVSCVAMPALAADLPGKAPTRPVAPVADWTGFYIGVHGGYGWGDNPFTEGFIEFDSPDFAIHGIESKGYVFGGHFGHNWQRGAWVGGIEIDISATGIKGSEERSASFRGDGATLTVTRARHDKFDLLGSARGRIGFLPTQSLLLYGTGGLAWTQFTQGGTVTQTIAAGNQSITQADAAENTSTRFGFAIGGGAEFRLTDNLFLRAEYLHYDFGTSQPTRSFALTCVNVPGCPNLSASDTSGRLTADVVRGGVSLKF